MLLSIFQSIFPALGCQENMVLFGGPVLHQVNFGGQLSQWGAHFLQQGKEPVTLIQSSKYNYVGKNLSYHFQIPLNPTIKWDQDPMVPTVHLVRRYRKFKKTSGFEALCQQCFTEACSALSCWRGVKGLGTVWSGWLTAASLSCRMQCNCLMIPSLSTSGWCVLSVHVPPSLWNALGMKIKRYENVIYYS